MRPVLSPEFDLRIFCYQVMDKDPAEVMQAASAEISYARHNHREQTTERQFRGGSKGSKYCDSLQSLIRMLMNGQMPSDPAPEFIEAVRPLVRNLLKKWRLGNLDDYFTE
jgi:hypothetical protein